MILPKSHKFLFTTGTVFYVILMTASVVLIDFMSFNSYFCISHSFNRMSLYAIYKDHAVSERKATKSTTTTTVATYVIQVLTFIFSVCNLLQCSCIFYWSCIIFKACWGS
jgi:hypothetical protein